MEAPLSKVEMDPRNKAFLDFMEDPTSDTTPVLTSLKKSASDLSSQTRNLIEESLSGALSLSEEERENRREFFRIASRSDVVVDKALDVFFTIPEEREKLIKKVPLIFILFFLTLIPFQLSIHFLSHFHSHSHPHSPAPRRPNTAWTFNSKARRTS